MVLLDTETSGTTREIYSEDADDGTRTGNLSVINSVLAVFCEARKPVFCETRKTVI